MPLRIEQYERSLAQPPLCEQLKVRDLSDNLLIQLNGSFVAGYRVSGICSYYASDDDRNRTKMLLEALIRSLPERSMRLQARFEISEGVGDLIARYNREQRNPNTVLQAIDREQSETWLGRMPTAITSSTHCISTSSGIRVSITNHRMSSGKRRCAARASACRPQSAWSGAGVSMRNWLPSSIA
jgi:hypothetical protein